MSTAIDDMLRAARDTHPDVWERTDAVARIISPEAFEEGWTIIEPKGAQELHDARMRYLQASARSKAQSVLQFLGVNTETDWYEVLDRMAKQAVAKDGPKKKPSTRSTPVGRPRSQKA